MNSTHVYDVESCLSGCAMLRFDVQIVSGWMHQIIAASFTSRDLVQACEITVSEDMSTLPTARPT